MHVPISHVIGTAALIGVVIAAGLSYTMITSSIDADVMKEQLNQIAEYVAVNLVEMTSLVNYANYSGAPMMKILNLPSDLGGRAYDISLLKLANVMGQGYYVQAQLVTRKEVSANSLIPFNSTQTHLTIITDGDGSLTIGGETRTIEYSGMVHGGTPDIVVWGWKENETNMWAGIGVWK